MVPCDRVRLLCSSRHTTKVEACLTCPATCYGCYAHVRSLYSSSWCCDAPGFKNYVSPLATDSDSKLQSLCQNQGNRLQFNFRCWFGNCFPSGGSQKKEASEGVSAEHRGLNLFNFLLCSILSNSRNLELQ